VYAGVPSVLKLGAVVALSRFDAHWKFR